MNIRALGLGACWLGLAACAPLRVRGPEPPATPPPGERVASAPAPATTEPPAVVAAAVTEVRAAAGAERFDVVVVDAPAKSFFLGLGNRGSANVLVHPNVGGSVSLNLRGVTVAEVLSAVRELYGYDYRRTAAGYLVLPAGLRTEFFSLNYLDADRSGESHIQVSSGSIADRSRSELGTGAAVATTADASGFAATAGVSAGAGTSIRTRTHADFWQQVEVNLAAIVGKGDGHSVVINRHSGVIAVKTDPESMRGVSEYLRRVQSTVSRQVVLEAKILEVELNDGFQAGINWAAILTQGSKSLGLGVSSPAEGFDTSLSQLGGRPINVTPGNGASGFSNTALASGFTMTLDTQDVNAVLDLLKVQGNTRVLSSPRVATLHNQKAVIKAGTDELFVTNVSSNTVTGTATATSREVELTPFFSGVALDVTPQIGSDDSLILHIHPSVSSVRDQTKRITVNGTVDELPLAVSDIRESDSVVRARSGQIVIIGGLMRNARSEQSYGTPGLQSIPGLGALFRSRRQQQRMTELVILLRPLVLGDNDSDPAAALAADRVAAIEAEAR